MTEDQTSLQKALDSLREEQEHLVELLQEKYSDVYTWLEENQLDPRALGDYVKNLAVVVMLTYATLTYQGGQVLATSSEQKEQHVIEVNSDRLKQSMTKEELRALGVWRKYEDPIIDSSVKYDLDPKIIFATIMVESGGNPEAIRHEPQIGDASYGLGQLLYGTARGIGYDGTPQGLYDPATNIDLVGRYHKRNLDVYGALTPEKLATAYNAGSPYSYPTYGHVDKFMTWYNIIDGLIISDVGGAIT